MAEDQASSTRKQQLDFVRNLYHSDDASIRTSLMTVFKELRMKFSPSHKPNLQHEFPCLTEQTQNFQPQDEIVALNFKLMLSIQGLSWLLKRDHTSFVKHQSPTLELSKQSFTNISQFYFTSRTKNLEDVQTLVSLCVLCALGKSQAFQAFVQSITQQHPFNGNHSVFLLLQTEHAYQYLPLLYGLTSTQIMTINECLSRLIFFDLSRFVNGEISYWNLVTSKTMQRTLDAGQLILQQQILQVLGSYGHIYYFSCMKFTENIYQKYFSVISKLQHWQYFSVTSQLQDQVFVKLQTDVMELQNQWIQRLFIPKALNSEEKQLLLKLMSMAQVSDIKEARSVFSAYDRLNEASKQTLLTEFNKSYQVLSNHVPQIVLCHSSLVLSNVIQRTSELEISQERALQVILTIFASILRTLESKSKEQVFQSIGFFEVDMSILNSHPQLWSTGCLFIGSVENVNNVISKHLSLVPSQSYIPYYPQSGQPPNQHTKKYIAGYHLKAK